MKKFDGVFDGDEVIGAVGVDAVDHRSEGGGLTRTGGSGDEHEAALLFANFVNDVREIEFLDSANFGRDDAENHADVAALLENVDAEAAQAGDAVGHVKLGGFLELLFLAVGHHAERHGEHFFWCDAGNFADRSQQAVNAEIGMVADLEVQVGGLVFYSAAKKIVNAYGHIQFSVFSRQ